MTNEQDVTLIQRVLDEAVKGGLIANLESAAAVWRAWGSIKYQLEENGKESSDNN